MSRYEYDLAGRRSQITDGEGNTTEYRYDAIGNIVEAIDGKGNHTLFENDLWGRVTAIHKPDESSEAYEYDFMGNVIATIDGNGNRVELYYNNMNKMAARVDSLGNAELFKYDIGGRMVEHTDRDGRIQSYSYNMYNSPIKHECNVDSSAESWEYDRFGRRTAAVGGEIRYEYEYYPNGSLKNKKANGEKLLCFNYDKLGRRRMVTDQTGKETRYEYNSNGRLEKITDNEKPVAFFDYNDDGTIKEKRIGNELVTKYQYDKNKNVSQMETFRKGEILSSSIYNYDENGNMIFKSENERTEAYTYDSCNRLTGARYSSDDKGHRKSEEFIYDKAGNRIAHCISRETGEEKKCYSYDQSNKVIKVDYQGNQRKSEEMQYDKQGNLLKGAKGLYTYDGFGRLRCTDFYDGSRQINHYDGENLRYKVAFNDRVSQYVFDEKMLVAEKDDKGNSLRYIRGVNCICSANSENDTYYDYICDEKNSVRMIFDEKLCNSYDYYSFGESKYCDERVANSLRYTGEQYDELSKSYYLRARNYYPGIARFSQEDTYYGDGLNLYSYCNNNPIRFADPSGHGGVENNINGTNANQGGTPTEPVSMEVMVRRFVVKGNAAELPYQNEKFSIYIMGIDSERRQFVVDFAQNNGVDIKNFYMLHNNGGIKWEGAYCVTDSADAIYHQNDVPEKSLAYYYMILEQMNNGN